MSIYIGNLSPAVDASLVEELVAQIAPASAVRVPRPRPGQPGPNYAFVDFADRADAEYALKVLQDSKVELFKRPIKVDWGQKEALKRKPSDAPAPRLFVGNLEPELVTESALTRPFSVFGTVLRVELPRHASGEAKGYALVTMRTAAEARSAMAALDGQYLLGRRCRVQFEM